MRKLVAGTILSIVLLFIIDMVILKIFPHIKFPVVILSISFSPVVIVFVTKALDYLFDIIRKPTKKALTKKKESTYKPTMVSDTKNSNFGIELVIPEGTTEIKNSEFENRNDIISVVIPEGVVTIGVSAFCGCKNLESVVLPYGVECIMDSAFKDCKKLKTISKVWSVKEIRTTAFSGCDTINKDDQFHINRISTITWANSLSVEAMEQFGVSPRWTDKDYDPSYDPYGPRNWH